MRQRFTVVVLALVAALAAVVAVRAPRAEGGILPGSGHAVHERAATDDIYAEYRRPTADTALADGFTPRRLRTGERPPQFIVVSFDGGGRHDMWDHWLGVADKVPFRFTTFLSGTYLLTDATRDRYRPPGLPAGSSEIGWLDAEGLQTLIGDLDRAAAAGVEIGTHYNGHFCDDSRSWTSREWDQELDQFFALVRDWRSNNDLPPGTSLALTGDDVLGGRTPCLVGTPETLFPALRDHAMTYDASFTRPGLAWPTQRDGIWQLGMVEWPVPGRLPDGRADVPVTTMDYNYWFTQRAAVDAPTAADSAADSAQVLATYRSIYDAAYDGNRAPILLGNHFNDWNRGAYTDALTAFVRETCTRPDTQCVSFRDLVAWLEVQSPRALADLQALPPQTPTRG